MQQKYIWICVFNLFEEKKNSDEGVTEKSLKMAGILTLSKGSRDTKLSLQVYSFIILVYAWIKKKIAVIKHGSEYSKNFIGGLTAPGHSNKLCEVIVQKLQEYGFSWTT